MKFYEKVLTFLIGLILAISTYICVNSMFGNQKLKQIDGVISYKSELNKFEDRLNNREYYLLDNKLNRIGNKLIRSEIIAYIDKVRSDGFTNEIWFDSNVPANFRDLDYYYGDNGDGNKIITLRMKDNKDENKYFMEKFYDERWKKLYNCYPNFSYTSFDMTNYYRCYNEYCMWIDMENKVEKRIEKESSDIIKEYDLAREKARLNYIKEEQRKYDLKAKEYLDKRF